MGFHELPRSRVINQPELLFISSLRFLPKALLRCAPASHLPKESKLFTPQVGGSGHFSSINEALVTVHYRDTLIEFVIREMWCWRPVRPRAKPVGR